MNLKNVEYTSYDDYMNGLIKSLSNFCNKSPLKAKINVVKELGLIYVRYNNKELEITIDVNEDKKKVIGDLKKELEKDYPIIYRKINCIPNANEIRKMLNQGKTLEDALNCTKTKFEPLYKIERVHDKYNEIDVISLSDRDMYKFKCKIPVIVILEDIKHLGKESDALDNISLLYKINKSTK
jgi:hypothetical protein